MSNPPGIPISPAIVLSTIAACIVGVWLLLPSKRLILERQLRDGLMDRAEATLARLSEREKRRDPIYFKALEFRLERHRLAREPLPAHVPDRLAALLQTGEMFGFAEPFLPEIEAWFELLPEVQGAYAKLEPAFSRLPPETHLAVAGRLSDHALTRNEPETAAAIYYAAQSRMPEKEAAAARAVQLFRMAGDIQKALGVIERYRNARPGALAARSAGLARAQVLLLRESSDPSAAFTALRELAGHSSVAERKELFPLLLTTARESSRIAELVPELRWQTRQSPDDPTLWEAQAEAGVAASDPVVAVEAAQALVRLRPGNRAHLARLAELHQWSGNPAAAFECCLSLWQQGDHSVAKTLFALAAATYREAELADALAAEHSPAPDAAQALATARLHVRVGNYDQARLIYERQLEDSDKFELWHEYAQLMLDLFEDELAQAALEKAAALDPRNDSVRRQLAQVCSRRGEYRKAFEICGSLVGQSEDLALIEGYITIAGSLGEIEAVIDGLQRRLQIVKDPSPRDYERLAHSYATQGRMDKQRALLKRALELFPDDDGLRLLSAWALADSSRFAEASEVLHPHGQLRLNPDVLQVYLSFLLRSGQGQKAARFVKTLSAELRGRPELLMAQADVCESVDDAAGAVAIYKQLRQAAPENLDIALRYARALSALGETAAAEKILEPHLDQNAPQVLKFAAEIYWLAGEFTRAESYYRRYLKTSPPDEAQVWRIVGDLLEASGDPASARKAYERGLARLARQKQEGAL